MQTKQLKILIFITSLLVSLPFFFTLAGDAQVHLAIADNFVNHNPFQYNPNGEIVVASTSPFWTMLLVLFFWIAGNWAPLLLKLTVIFAWLATAIFLHRVSQKHWNFSPSLAIVTTGLWLTHTTVVANALSGLENILSALQLFVLYYFTVTFGPNLTKRRVILMGLWAGWALLTRPDGGLFALVLLAAYFLRVTLDPTTAGINKSNYLTKLKQILPTILVLLVSIFVVLLPWYLYQASITGKLVTDSSLARLYMGRQGSIMLLPDRLYFHPKATISLITGYLPLMVGLITIFYNYGRQFIHSEQRTAWFVQKSPQITAVTLFITGFLFYSFGVGAESFGRYFLPLYPFLFLTGVAGLKMIYDWLVNYRPIIATGFVVLAILFFATVSGYDYYRRLVPGRFEQNHVLDAIYGPAHLQYFSFNLMDLVKAPTQRSQLTDAFLTSLGVENSSHVSIAVTEVQLRYFLDERVDVMSLDGRTSANLVHYFNKTNGVPDFAAFFKATKPDFVHVNQWCRVGGWLAAIRPAHIGDNLICQWQGQIAEMAVGDNFMWDGHTVKVIAPEIVQIKW